VTRRVVLGEQDPGTRPWDCCDPIDQDATGFPRVMAAGRGVTDMYSFVHGADESLTVLDGEARPCCNLGVQAEANVAQQS
jgi:hypothetical protein